MYWSNKEEFLSRLFLSSTVTNDHALFFELSFSVKNATKNAPLVFTVLETLPKDSCCIEKDSVTVKLHEDALFTNIAIVADVLCVIKQWKSVELLVNGVTIGTTTEFDYLIDYLFEKNHRNRPYLHRSVEEVKKTYSHAKKKRSTVLVPARKELISRLDAVGALNTVVKKYVELYGTHKEIKQFSSSRHEFILTIEDSLVVAFRLLPRSWRREADGSYEDWKYPYIMFQELTHNDLFSFNYTGFARNFKMDYIGLEYLGYHGVHYYRKEVDCYDEVNIKYPELRLDERNEAYPGELHHFVILRMLSLDGHVVYGVGDTKTKVHSFVLKLCKELEEKNSRTLELNGASCLPFSENRDFVEAFLSWKGEKKRWRLENKFSYFYEDRWVKNDLELFRIPKEILDEARMGSYDKCEFGMYSKPINRWKSEELVYNITRKLYKDYQVIYQYHPFFLQTDKGSMSYDIYICGLKIAIEYQGKQHFEPIDYFGGQESYERQKERDRYKVERSKENGVRLVYINYWEDIVPDLIKKRVEEAIN